MGSVESTTNSGTVRYRLEVGGRVTAEWIGWFEAVTVTPVRNNTVLEVQVADQAELFGRLRRIHDLNLRLVSLIRLNPSEPKPNGESQ